MVCFLTRRTALQSQCLLQRQSGISNRGKEPSGDFDNEGAQSERDQFGNNFKTLMKQWNKDLEAIEMRGKARRKQQQIQEGNNEAPDDSKLKENDQRFDYLKLERRKASEAWSNARLNENKLTSSSIYPWKTNLGIDINELSKSSPDTRNSDSNLRRSTTNRDNPTPFEKKVFRKLDHLQPAETKKVPESGKVSEALWEIKFDRARRQREKLLQNTSAKDMESEAEYNRVKRFKINLSRWETEKYRTMKHNYLKDLMELEMKQRETAKYIRSANKELRKKK